MPNGDKGARKQSLTMIRRENWPGIQDRISDMRDVGGCVRYHPTYGSFLPCLLFILDNYVIGQNVTRIFAFVFL